MKHQEAKTLRISDIIEKHLPFSEIISHGNDYLLAVLSVSDHELWNTGTPYKFDGLVFLYCTRGEYIIRKGYVETTLRERNFMAIYPDDIIKGVTAEKEGELTGLFLMRNFLRELNFNLNVFSSLDMLGVRTPSITLSEPDFQMLTLYFSLLKHNAQSRVNVQTDDVFTRNIARNITAALFYNLMLLTRDSSRDAQGHAQTSRKAGYVLDFMSMLQDNYKRERNVKFYAERMCISPKYLSMIIKNATGKSAAEWIDECVILEAKNLLRFSGLNVQQVAYEMNFRSQGLFGKYFKHFTGMSPTEFQNT